MGRKAVDLIEVMAKKIKEGAYGRKYELSYINYTVYVSYENEGDHPDDVEMGRLNSSIEYKKLKELL